MHDRPSSLHPLFAFLNLLLRGSHLGSTLSSAGVAICCSRRVRGALAMCGAPLLLSWPIRGYTQTVERTVLIGEVADCVAVDLDRTTHTSTVLIASQPCAVALNPVLSKIHVAEHDSKNLPVTAEAATASNISTLGLCRRLDGTGSHFRENLIGTLSESCESRPSLKELP